MSLRLGVKSSLALLASFIATSGCRATAPTAPPMTPARALVVLAPAPVPPLPELVFRAGEPPWRALGISVVVSAPAATEATLDALSRKLALQTPLGHALIDVLTGRNVRGVPLSRDLLETLDPTAPLVLVALAPGIGVTGGTAWGLTFRDAAAARRALAAVGVEAARAGGASTRRFSDGSVVDVGVHGRTLLFSTTPRLISVAGALIEALAARPPEHLATVSVFPQALPVGAAVLGSGLEVLVTKALREQREATSTPGKPSAFAITDGLLATAGLAARLVGGVVADTRAVRLELDLDERAGLALRFAIEPTPGSTLEGRLRSPTPAKVDARLLAPDADLLAAWGLPAAPAWFDELVVASGPAGRTLLSDWKAWRGLFVGPGSCRGDHAISAATTTVCAQPFARGVKSKDLLRRYVVLAKDMTPWLNELGGLSLPPPKLRLVGDVVEIEQDADVPGEPADARARRHAAFGGAIRRSAFVARVADGLYVWAPDRPSASAALARRAGASSSPAIAAVLAHGEGADVVAALDVVPLVKAVVAAANDPRIRQGSVMLNGIRGVADLHLPFGITARTGERAAFELQVPIESLRNVADVVRPYMGVLGAHAKP